MNFKHLVQVFSVQLNFIFMVVIFDQQTKINSLIYSIREVENKLDKFHTEFESIKVIKDTVVENSGQLTNYLNFYSSSKILLLISSVMFILKVIKICQSMM